MIRVASHPLRQCVACVFGFFLVMLVCARSAVAQVETAHVAGEVGEAGLWMIEPDPAVFELGEDTVLRVRSRAGVGIEGLAVAVVEPEGAARSLGRTDANGDVRFVPTRAGRHSARVEGSSGVRASVAFDVLEPPGRTGWFVLGAVLAGLALRGPIRALRAALAARRSAAESV